MNHIAGVLAVAVISVTIGALEGCASSPPRGFGKGPDCIVIDRGFLHGIPDYPRFDDVDPHCDELIYLARNGDAEAIAAILRFISSGHLPDQIIDDLLGAPVEWITQNAMWTCLPRLSAERQVTVLRYYNALSGAPCHHLIDWDTDRDAYLAEHPEVRAVYASTP
jgi:hypothetical protein